MNEHIKDYLDYYLKLDCPEFAILLDGEWGAGKTHFIKNYFKKNKNAEHIYVSLNGVSSTKGIEDQFFEQLHPFLSSKASRITGKILKGLLKASLKIDLDRDDSSDGSVGIQLPDLNLSDELNDAGNRILIFDDLERANMKPQEILGYINQFVEHDGQKVLLIGSEDKWDKKKSVKKLKEKVIGRTFKIQPSFDEAFKNFLEEINSDTLRKIVKENQWFINLVFLKSGFNNLRLLRYGLIEFERFFGLIKSKYEKSTSKKQFAKDTIEFFFVFNFEIGQGEIEPNYLTEFENLMLLSSSKSLVEKPKAILIQEKYGPLDFHKPIFSYDFWKKYFMYGQVDQTDLESVLKNPQYFEKEIPLWKKLWDFWETDSKELTQNVSEAERKLKEKSFTNLGEVIHICGTLMKLIELKIYSSSTKENVSRDCLDQIKQLFIEDQIKVNLTHSNGLGWRLRDYNMGHGFQSSKDKIFMDFLNEVKNLYEKKQREILQKKSHEMMSILKDDVEDFCSIISGENPEGLHVTPVISLLELTNFLEIFQQKTLKEKRNIIFCFRDRAKWSNISDEEKRWLKNFLKEMNNSLISMDICIEKISLLAAINGLKDDLN